VEVRRGAERSRVRDLSIQYSVQCLEAVSEHKLLILNGSCTDILS
jgi:hypothetical protein